MASIQNGTLFLFFLFLFYFSLLIFLLGSSVFENVFKKRNGKEIRIIDVLFTFPEEVAHSCRNFASIQYKNFLNLETKLILIIKGFTFYMEEILLFKQNTNFSPIEVN